MPNEGTEGHLIVKRRAKQGVRIGDALVTVVRVIGPEVTLSIRAPRAVQIVRVRCDGSQEVRP